MKFRKRPRNDIAIELVPLVDVVLVLLLFFMVSTTFIRQSELKVRTAGSKCDIAADR